MPGLRDAGAPDAAAVDAGFPTTGIGTGALTVTGVEPASGPFSGDNVAVVRGSAFTQDAVVRIGGSMLEASFVTLENRGRLRVVVPAGTVGPADVSVSLGDDTVTLRDGYHYNGLALQPAEGSTAGGTLVEITVANASLPKTADIADMMADMRVTFADMPCTQLSVLTPQRVRCRAPAHVQGRVDVRAYWPQDRGLDIVARGAFEYVDTSATDLGGLSGGPAEGIVNVTVVDSTGGFVIPGALVLVGNDPATPHQGLTNERGAITFSGDDLQGPVTVHAAKKCFERGSIVAFDARNVTLFLWPVLDLSCLPDAELNPGGGGGGGGGHGQLGSLVSGELVFPGPDEFDPNTWDIVPKPRAGEVRVAYVFTSQSSPDSRNPSPAAGADSIARLEEATAARGQKGYPYRIFARPAGLAVYALAGVEDLATREFTPYVLGVARNVVTSPGVETKNIDLAMLLTLDRSLKLDLSDAPAATSVGPDTTRVRAHLDLGGEGVIAREVSGESFDVISRALGSTRFDLAGQPPLTGVLADGSYLVVAGFYTRDREVPYTEQRRFGIRPEGAPLLLDGFLGVPALASPALGAAIPSDRRLLFTLTGSDPDFIIVTITGGDGLPAWQQILPGHAREIPVPDLSQISGQDDIAAGFVTWRVQAVKVGNFDYDNFRYSFLSPRYFTHHSANAFTLRR